MRDQIWDTAIGLFAEKGFDETTVDDIARKSGVSRRSFFRYFSSKNDLLAQGILTYGVAVTGAIERCPRSHPISKVLREAVLHVAQQAVLHPRTRMLIEIATKYPAAREAQLSRMGEVQEQVAMAYTSRCKTSRKGNDLAPRILARLTFSMIDTALQHWFEHGRKEIAPIVDQLFSTVFELMFDSGATQR